MSANKFNLVAIIRLWTQLGLSRRPQWRITLLTLFIYSVNAGLLFVTYRWSAQRNDFFGYFILALICFGLIWLWFPRFFETPPTIVLTDKKAFPELNHLVANLANCLGTSPPNLLMTEQLTAAYVRLGWRRRPHLMLGHSLMSLLDPAELITLISHELTHARDGSIARHLFVRLAMSAWYRWCRMLCGLVELRDVHPLFKPFSALVYLIARPSLWLGRKLLQAVNLDQQSAEYYADYVAERITQTGSIGALLQKIEVARAVQHVGAAYEHAAANEKYDAIRHAFASVPNEHKQTVWQGVLAYTSTDQSHPPITDRLAIQRAEYEHPPLFSVSQEQFARVQQELKRWPIVMASRERALASEPRWEPASLPAPAMLHITSYYH